MTQAPGSQAPRPGRRRLAWVVLAVVAAAALGIGLTVTGGEGPQRAPAFSLPRLGGGTSVSFPLTGPARHRPVVLTFFASWCAPCHRELPMVAAVARKERGSRHDVVFVGVDGNDDPSSGLSFARRSGVSFAVAEDSASELAPKFLLVGYPGTVFIDASGLVVGTVHGPVSRATLERFLGRLART